MEKLKYSLLFMISILAISNRWVSANEIDNERNRIYNSSYSGKYNNRIAFPIGGIGAGMYCLEGTGYISHMSVWHRPEVFHEPGMFAALYVKGVCNGTKVLEGPVSDWRKFGMPNYGTGGSMGSILGLPRFDTVEFEARFPFAKVSLTDKDIPVKVTILGWSPFIPGDPDNSSLPVGGLEYSLENTSKEVQETIFSYHARNFLSWGKGLDVIKTMPHGFILSQSGTETEPHLQGDFAIFTDQDSLKINYCWFRGGWFDSLTMVWNAIEAGLMPQCPAIEKGAPGASMFVPVTLMPGEKKTIRIYTAWYVPNSTLRLGEEPEDWNDNNVDSARLAVEKADKGNYKPWYSSRFTGVNEVIDYFLSHYKILRNQTERFTDSFYRSTLPPEVIEAVSANLSILKSPTVMRQYDGRLWTWEGCADNWGSCHGSCTHVWNYAQAIPHLFPSLERSLRHTEFEEGQDLKGHQVFRANLPIRPTRHNFHSAADGQLGGIMKVYREWRISGENEFLISMYPKVKKSLDYCISTWDPRRVGSIEEPHHNTYDIEFWGPDGMHNSFYYGALSAFIRMSEFLDKDVTEYKKLLKKGRKFTETGLFNGEYFIQNIEWRGLNAKDPTVAQSFHSSYSPEAKEILEKEGPKYQYGNGCLSDGVLGSWLSRMCGMEETLNTEKVKSHLLSVHRYNFKKDLTDHANPQRSPYALGKEGGLLLGSWPKGGKLSLPFVYSNEVWTGIEYQVASHLMLQGEVEKGLEIVRACRQRYDGSVRNPFNEYECGHWYGRALSSYGLLQGLTGVRYDAVDKTLYINSKIGDFISFISTESGFGNVELRSGKPFVKVVSGHIEVDRFIVSGKVVE